MLRPTSLRLMLGRLQPRVLRFENKSDGMDGAVARFAAAYSDQTERDYDALVKAAKEKRIPVAKVAE